MAASSPATTAPLLNTTALSDPDDSSKRITVVLIVYLVVLPAMWAAPIALDFFRHRFRRGEPVSASLVDASVNQLEVAEQARRRLHARVNQTVWQLGWTLCHSCTMVYYVISLIRIGVSIIDIQPVVGSYILHLGGAVWSSPLFTLSVQPIETSRLDKILLFMTIFSIILVFLFASAARALYDTGLIAYSIVVIIGCVETSLLFCAVSSAHSLYGHKYFGGDPLPARRKLQRLWLTNRLFYFMGGIGFLVTGIFRWTCLDSECILPPSDCIICGVSCSLCCLATTPDVRGRFARWLGSLGKSGPAEQQAATVLGTYRV